MQARFVHRCTHVIDKQRTIEFYEKALGFHVVRESGPADGSWTNTFMESDACPFQLELTWNRGRTEPYDNGGRDQHIAFVVDDFDAYHELHMHRLRERGDGTLLHLRPGGPAHRDSAGEALASPVRRHVATALLMCVVTWC